MSTLSVEDVPETLEQLTLPVPSRLAVRSYGLSDPGRVRPANEDHFLVAELTKAIQVQHSTREHHERHEGDERGQLFLVADGMGGHQAGEQASALAVETVEGFVLNRLKWFFTLKSESKDVLHEFQEALREADLRVFEEARTRPELAGMGTTLTMVYCLGSVLFVAHVGDSRAYLLRGGKLKRLTHDHTLVGELLRRGAISPQDAEHHHLKHVIVNAVGGHEAGVEVEAHKFDLQAGDVLLLCTDGLTEMVPEAEIVATLQAEGDPKRACERLIEMANANGGKDNVTAVVAHFSVV